MLDQTSQRASRVALLIGFLVMSVAALWLFASDAAGTNASERPQQVLSVLERRATARDELPHVVRLAADDGGIRAGTARLLDRDERGAYYAGVDGDDGVCLVADLDIEGAGSKGESERITVSGCESVAAFAERGVQVGVHVEGRGGRVLVLLPDSVDRAADGRGNRSVVRDNLVEYVHDHARLSDEPGWQRTMRMARYELTGQQRAGQLLLPADSRRVR